MLEDISGGTVEVVVSLVVTLQVSLRVEQGQAEVAAVRDGRVTRLDVTNQILPRSTLWGQFNTKLFKLVNTLCN